MSKAESDNLLNLLSTRFQDKQKKDAEGGEQANRSPEPMQSRSVSETATNNSSTNKTAGKCLSPLSSAVLKEAKRALGSHDTQSNGKNISETQIAGAVDRVCEERDVKLQDTVRADIIVHLKQDLVGWGILQEVMEKEDVTDIHCYDFQTVVVQRGKSSETTGISWPSKEAYMSFIDRILLQLGKSVSTHQHTVDASFPDGKRVCVMHESVCSNRGPLMTVRIPRVNETTLESLLDYEVAPPLIIKYLAALVGTCEHTMIVAGETGTGKTTLLKCLGTQFRDDESIIGVEDTPELNYQHPYYRGLVSRYANTEGVGEVTLQEHIKATLRLCPTRVILGEMRSPEAAEAFLESAQTGHCGMSTIHARNARETLTRLESLLGRAQRGVSMDVLRQQIALAVDVIVWMARERGAGKIRIAEVLEVGNFSEGQIQVRPMFKLVETGDDAKWQVQSWSSFSERVLDENRIDLGSAPKILSMSNDKRPKLKVANKR